MRLRTMLLPAVLVVCVAGAQRTALAAPALDVCDTSNCATLDVTALPGSNGSGRVTSDPTGIDCRFDAMDGTGACEIRFVWLSTQEYLDVKLVYAPATGSLVVAPGGDTEARSVLNPVRLRNDEFELVSTYGFTLTTHRVDVSTSGAGSGVVEYGGKTQCRKPCSFVATYGKKVTLEAKPDAGAVFRTWTGACNGQKASCMLTVTQATSTNAVFELADTSVDAELVAARATVTKRGARRVRVELSLDENLAVTLWLLRGGKQLASKSFARVRDGERVLILLVPPRVKPGRAALRIELADEAGNKRAATRAIQIPKRSKYS